VVTENADRSKDEASSIIAAQRDIRDQRRIPIQPNNWMAPLTLYNGID
jgi:hypothetical protein